jgi:hypothetical protein
MRRGGRFAGLCVCAGALFGATATAEATCYSSTPSAATFVDHPFDGDNGLAPEISTVGLALDGACTVSMNPGIDALVGDDAVFTYINRDGNAATGSPSFSGADIVVGTLGEIGADYPPILGTWNGVEFTFSDSSPVGPAPSLGGFAAHVDRLGLSPGATIGVRLGTIWRGISYDYFDFAPEPGASSIPLAVNFSTTPPPPPPPPPPAPTPVPTPVSTPVPLPTAPAEDEAVEATGCTVPKVTGKTRAAAETKLFDAVCEVAFSVVKRYSNTVRKGRVIGTTPGTGNVASKRVKLIVSKGRKRARARVSSVSPSLLERLETLANAPVR